MPALELQDANTACSSRSWDCQFVINGAAFLVVEALDHALPCNPGVADGVPLCVSSFCVPALPECSVISFLIPNVLLISLSQNVAFPSLL